MSKTYSPEHISNFMHYCPHCGSNNFTPASNKEMRCADCGFQFFQNAATAVACIITDANGRILLTRRAFNPWKGMLDLPGGFVDPSETVENAVKRELNEELGTKVMQMKYICSFPNEYIFSNYLVYTVDLGFICEVDDVQALRAADDVDKLLWFYPSELPINQVAAPSIRNILKYYLSAQAK